MSFIFYQPTVELAESYVKTKINPMIDCNPELAEIFKGKTTNNLSEKSFKGCVGSYKGGNTGNSYRMLSAPIVLADEIDSLPRDIEGEGAPGILMRNRMQSYGQKAKLVETSTPTEKDTSNIEDEFNKGDQNYYYLPCPKCHVKQPLNFYIGLKYTKHPQNENIVLPGSVYYECQNPECKEHITEDNKTWMLANGQWIPHNPEAPKNFKSFQMSSLYSPLGWLGWEALCNDWIACQKDNEAKKAFVNTKLGETWYEKSEQPSHAKLKARAEPYERYEVNEQVVRLFAGIDTQDDRFEVLVLGFGKDQEQWVVDYAVIPGRPTDPSAWNDLKLYIDRPFKSRTGVDLFIEAAGMDTQGHFVAEKYDFIRKNQNKFYAIRGASTNIGSFMKQGNAVDKDLKTGQAYSNPLYIYLVNTVLAKKTIYGNLNNMLTNDTMEGANVIHFPSHLQDNFYNMLTAERLVRQLKNGALKEQFICPKGTRNEALDCYVYAYCLAYVFGKVNNLYGTEYDRVYDQIIGKKVLTNVPTVVKPPSRVLNKKDSWLGKNKNGFSIKR